jgi:hypothetical protein
MVEVPPPPVTVAWHISSASGGGACVQVAHTHEYLWVRDSKNPNGPSLGVTPEGWAVFIGEIQRNSFNC